MTFTFISPLLQAPGPRLCDSSSLSLRSSSRAFFSSSSCFFKSSAVVALTAVLSKKDAVNNASADGWPSIPVQCHYIKVRRKDGGARFKASVPESYTSRSYGARWASSCWAESARAAAERKGRWLRMAAGAGNMFNSKTVSPSTPK